MIANGGPGGNSPSADAARERGPGAQLDAKEARRQQIESGERPRLVSSLRLRCCCSRVHLLADAMGAATSPFTEYKIITPPTWVGLQNFEDLLDDPVFFISLSEFAAVSARSCRRSSSARSVLAVLVNNSLPGIKAFTRRVLPAGRHVGIGASASCGGGCTTSRASINAVLQWLALDQLRRSGWLERRSSGDFFA